MNAKKNALFQCKELRESKTAIMQIESTHVCSALWRIRVDKMTNLTLSHFLHDVVYMCQKS